MYSVRTYDKFFIDQYQTDELKIQLTGESLNLNSVDLAVGSEAITVFSKDDLSENVIEALHDIGVKLIVTRSTGYNHIDLTTASNLGIKVAHVPAYSPESIAEHAVMLMLSLSKNLIRANDRIRNYNFSLEGLLGSRLGEKQVGVIGTGKIGLATIKILRGFGCHVVAHDIEEDSIAARSYDFTYMPLEELLSGSDIISLHVPLTPSTQHMLNDESLKLVKQNAIVINTSRGGLIDTESLLRALDAGRLAKAGLDVYENEKDYFFYDHSKTSKRDSVLTELIDHDKVLLTAHQAYLTDEALSNIWKTTFCNCLYFYRKLSCSNFLV